MGRAREVEARLLTHDAVAQAVVVAGRDADGLEKPVAYVVLRPGGRASETELVNFCRDGLPAYKRPRRVVFVDGYPTTATGKVRRVELRVMATTVLATTVPATTVPATCRATTGQASAGPARLGGYAGLAEKEATAP